MNPPHEANRWPQKISNTAATLILCFSQNAQAAPLGSEDSPSPLPQDSSSATKFILTLSDWCPFVCAMGQSSMPHKDKLKKAEPDLPSRPAEGILVDWITATAEEYGHQIEWQVMPFVTGLRAVEQGKADAVLGHFKNAERARYMIFEEPVIRSRSCFVGRRNSQWKFQGLNSLNEKRIGIIRGYTYPGFDEYFKTHKGLVYMHGDNEIDRLLRMLRLKRIDVFLEEENVVSWYLRTSGRYKEVTFLGCSNVINEIFVAGSRTSANGRKLNAMIRKALTNDRLNAVLEASRVKHTQGQARPLDEPKGGETAQP